MNASHIQYDIEAEIDAVLAAVDAADRTDVSSLDPVLSSLDRLQGTLTRTDVPAEVHAEVRAALDRVMSAVASLVKDLTETKDEVGRTLAKLRAKKRPGYAAASRIDVRF